MSSWPEESVFDGVCNGKNMSTETPHLRDGHCPPDNSSTRNFCSLFKVCDKRHCLRNDAPTNVNKTKSLINSPQDS